ncbi:MAG TPA: hypothetical protein VL866_24140 [Pyrinomonadaceae bacterium]|nr:hypothetical protein [Pyrinomonadaceae bacterium]
MTCTHESFSGSVEVGRIVDRSPIEFIAEVTIHCDECGLPFTFDENHFAVSVDRLRLRYKLKPASTVSSNGRLN